MTKPGQIPSGPWLFQPTKPGEVPSGPWLFEPSAPPVSGWKPYFASQVSGIIGGGKGTK